MEKTVLNEEISVNKYQKNINHMQQFLRVRGKIKKMLACSSSNLTHPNI